MKKILCSLVLLLACFVSSFQTHATYTLPKKTIDVIVLKVEMLMKTDYQAFETLMNRFYVVMSTLPSQKYEKLRPLIERLDVLVDTYNANILKNPVTITTTSTIVGANIIASQSDLTRILSGLILEKIGTSDILVIEYSDFECPFCRQHFNNGTMDTDQKLFLVFRQML